MKARASAFMLIWLW